MKTRFTVLLSLISFSGCRTMNDGNKGRVDTATVPAPADTEDTANRPDPTDSADPADPADPADSGDSAAPEPVPEEDPGPVGTWSTCKGTLSRTATTFTWNSEIDSCSIEGASTFEDGLVSMHGYTLDTCEDTPWWLKLFPEGPATYQPLVIGDRLTLVPTIPVPTGRVLHLEKTVVVKYWNLVSNEGDTNDIKMCWTPDGLFMEGHYRNTNDSTNFISDAGIITEVLPGIGDAINWSARCWGDCPCSAIMTIDNKTETTLDGRYHGSNCVRTFEGTFTGTATP